ncbi:MAG: methyltransferase domain-containing protein [Microbacteriaceae bacterium]|jgi:SAM-dependent methyltransferase|nr:methyltransferase domain-containing protein [Microbacteriaceae bacterium]HOA86090.1 methyltransferase domain-containing protein [Microbacteriaceae bacterium]HQC92918.1 methyltransferase domain-containing protein [Microbacteriaceae bacterium]
MSSDRIGEMATSFGRAAASYEAGRPGYPPAAVEWMLQPAAAASTRGLRVTDVGAGTGKLTRALLACDPGVPLDVVAIDPDPLMLEALAASIPGVPTAPGTAERLPLDDASVDAIVLGQAWHWVDPEAGALETARALRPGGVLGLVWNIRDAQVPWVARMTAIMHRSNAEALLDAGGPRVLAPFGALETASFSWSRPMTADALIEMARSRSYLITASAGERARIEAELRALFGTLPALRDGGAIELPYRTHAFRAVRP